MELAKLDDEMLLIETDRAVEHEKVAVLNVTRHFVEVYKRRLYLPQYTSLFDMLRRKYGFCEPSAQLRLNAVRLITDVPDVKQKIESGELSLTVAANIQSFLFKQKRQDREYSGDAKLELVETCINKSVASAKKEFARRDPEAVKRDVVRAVGEDRVRVSHSSSARLEENLAKIKMIWSHVDPNMSREDLLMRMSDIVLDRIDPDRKAAPAKKRAEDKVILKVDPLTATGDTDSLRSTEVAESREISTVRNRYITADARHDVHLQNDERGCEFVNDVSGEVCGSKFQLQIDHVKPFSHGGSNESDNLRTYCAVHNRWIWRMRSTVRGGSTEKNRGRRSVRLQKPAPRP